MLHYDMIAKSNSNRVVAFLLQKLETNQEKIRLATLDILKHLINSCGMLTCAGVCACAIMFLTTSLDDELEDKKPLIVSGLKIILQDPNLKVRDTVEPSIPIHVLLGQFNLTQGVRNRVVPL